MDDGNNSVRISVRTLVEFILRSGNIDNRHKASADYNALLEGGRIHRMIQRRMGANYHAEYFLRHIIPVRTDQTEFDIVIEGRADGVIIEPKLNHEEMLPGPECTDLSPYDVTIDEIKSVYKDLIFIKEPSEIHLAQAKCYAYFLAAEKKLDEIRVRMTYCNVETEEIKYFHNDYTFEELQTWFGEIIQNYSRWAEFEFEWKKIRKGSVQQLEFPFPYRDGQKELVSQVYRTIYHKKKIFIEAPTGVGKTISTIFPAVKAVGEDLSDKIFYLTAKTITRTVAYECFALLRSKGLRYKTVMLTAKEKICPLEETDCNPVACERALGHYDRINEAIYDLLVHEDDYGRENIEAYAKKHCVCPFEFGLDMTLFSDAIICDYNYVFDPNVYLRRFFGEGIQGNYLFLIDEAHNLVDRAMEMYSAVLYKEDVMDLKRQMKVHHKKMEKALESVNKQMLGLKREAETMQLLDVTGSGVGISMTAFLNSLLRLMSVMEKYFEEDDKAEISNKELHKETFDLYLLVRHFTNMYENIIVEENGSCNYVAYCRHEEDGSFMIKLLCVNPSSNLSKCMSKGRSTALFSATLLPIDYYRNLLSGDEKDYAVYAQSIFDENKRGLFICEDVTSKYSRRSESEYQKIARYIYEVVQKKCGNYLIFFPSHSFLNQVLQYFEEYAECLEADIVMQKASMNETEREEFLSRFDSEQNENCLLGFCVMGGIFSEGIDLKQDRLIGTVIVGTGLPMVCDERELLKECYADEGLAGFDYAYRYPGMNKVLQAAGRVIRTAEDIGVVVLLDDRFLSYAYQKMYPREWKNYRVCNIQNIGSCVEQFWNAHEGRE
ncbi:MAG: ATP-dependent DNA helicase [Clostridia bacterium]|nr:ATP-dependent DNA helicase [Clostridia bacterium]